MSNKRDNKIISYYRSRAEYQNEDIRNKYKDFYKKHTELVEVTEEIDCIENQSSELEERFFSVVMNEIYRNQYGGVLINSLNHISEDILEIIYFLTLAREHDFKIYLLEKDIELVAFLENRKAELKEIFEKDLFENRVFKQKENEEDLGLKL